MLIHLRSWLDTARRRRGHDVKRVVWCLYTERVDVPLAIGISSWVLRFKLVWINVRMTLRLFVLVLSILISYNAFNRQVLPEMSLFCLDGALTECEHFGTCALGDRPRISRLLPRFCIHIEVDRMPAG